MVDLLPDREVDTSAAWMRQQPDLMLVSRDRGKTYASAAREGAPQAIECADRFHLLKNLGEALEGLLAHHLAAHRKRQTQAMLHEVTPVWQSKRTPRYSPKLQQLQQARREERMALYDQVLALRKQGMSQQAIAERVGVGHSTVSNWLAAGPFPERKPREQASRLDPYLPYIFERWESGCHNMARLFRELIAQDYKGSYESVRGTLLRLLPEERKTQASSSSKTPALVTSPP